MVNISKFVIKTVKQDERKRLNNAQAKMVKGMETDSAVQFCDR